MSPENTLKLLTQFPLLYRNLRGMNFECGDGWFDLIYQASIQIEELAFKYGIAKTPETWPQFLIVKEKMGWLRMQGLRNVNESFRREAYAILEFYEMQSMRICEICSAPANADEFCTPGGWLKTLCPECAKKNPRITHTKSAGLKMP
jgi:hypothetical protein